jgi:hypothetical protein
MTVRTAAEVPRRESQDSLYGLQLKKNVLGQDLAFTIGKYAGPLDHISQFADVSWPVMTAQSLHRSSA